MDRDIGMITADSSPTGGTCVSRTGTAADVTSPTPGIPFHRSNELCTDLVYICEPEKPSYLHNQGSRQTLPDAPRINLRCTSSLLEYCLTDIDTPRLNHLDEKLWWAGPIPDIAPLTQHLVLERRIQVTEDPSVHLLWTDGVLHIKPLPAYLTSSAFWAFLHDTTNPAVPPATRDKLRATALGFLRTYAHLIKHRSDFTLARRCDLLCSFPDTSFEAFTAFISSVDKIPDSAVSPRWRYGLLHLDALNLHSAIHLRRWHLNRFESRYGAYFARFFPVVLFVFAVFSVVLSAMQVILAARQLWGTDNKGLQRTLGLFVWFGTEAIGWSLAVAVLFVVWWVGISGVEALGRRKARKRCKKKLKEERLPGA
ncbi:hypothetical protein ACN47E_003504 [Coniothyrium glycines]